jgi:GT2 family glycosyltransferase
VATVSAAPDISVVVATRDRRERLAALLDSLAAQTFPSERFEVVVVDDASRDSTPDLLAARQRSGELRLRSLRRDAAGGPAVARNRGWRAARGSLIAFTDDDCEAQPGWLEELCEAARKAPGTVLQGRTEPIGRERDRIGIFTRTIEVAQRGPWFETCNIAYPRSVLERLGGFDEGFPPSPGGEDTDLAWRALEAGAPIAYVPEAVVGHAVNDLGPVGKLRVALRWSDTAWIFGRHPALRRQFHWGVFWKPSHAKLLLAVAGLLLARRFPPALLLGLPYYREAVGRCNEAGTSRTGVPYIALHDAVETFAAVRGGLRYRVPVA